MNNSVPTEDYERIEQMIESNESVVGIDAKETHIIIIHMLEKIQQRLDSMEKRLDAQE